MKNVTFSLQSITNGYTWIKYKSYFWKVKILFLSPILVIKLQQEEMVKISFDFVMSVQKPRIWLGPDLSSNQTGM